MPPPIMPIDRPRVEGTGCGVRDAGYKGGTQVCGLPHRMPQHGHPSRPLGPVRIKLGVGVGVRVRVRVRVRVTGTVKARVRVRVRVS